MHLQFAPLNFVLLRKSNSIFHICMREGSQERKILIVILSLVFQNIFHHFRCTAQKKNHRIILKFVELKNPLNFNALLMQNFIQLSCSKVNFSRQKIIHTNGAEPNHKFQFDGPSLINYSFLNYMLKYRLNSVTEWESYHN